VWTSRPLPSGANVKCDVKKKYFYLSLFLKSDYILTFNLVGFLGHQIGLKMPSGHGVKYIGTTDHITRTHILMIYKNPPPSPLLSWLHFANVLALVM
jgi:hypothetical protein